MKGWTRALHGAALATGYWLLATIVVAQGAAPLRTRTAGTWSPALSVARVVPAPGSRGVPVTGLVAVIFDRPVVPLARLGGGPVAATISPPVPGEQRWLGTATWSIIPAHGLAPATTYTLRLNTALRAVDGTTLSAPTSWQFTTLLPAVSGVAPNDGASGVLPRAPVDVTFNVPVVHSSAEAHFTLCAGASPCAPVSGAFSWRGARTMRFTPAAPLPRGASLTVRETAGVAAVGGRIPGVRAFTSRFGVAPAFDLKSSEPANGASAVNPYLTVLLHFTAPVDLARAPRYLRVAPALAAMHVDVSDQDTLSISGDFRPSTTYRVAVLAGLPDLLGDRLPVARAVGFTTAAYSPSLQLFGIGSLNTYDAYRGVRLYAAATNVARVTISLYRQSEAEFVRTNATDFNRSAYTPAGLPLVSTYTQAVNAPLNRAVTVAQHLTLPGGRPLPPGYYAAFARAPGVGAYGNTPLQYLPLLVTRSSLTLKNGDNQVLLWANDLRSGASLGGLRVRVLDANGHAVISGRTRPDGVYVGTLPPGRHLAYQTLRAFLDRPGDAAAVGSDWSDGISPYDYNLTYDPTLMRVRMYLNTDRPIYRPGQSVYYRAVIRGDDDGRYRVLPAGYREHLTATDALNHTILDTYARINSQGVVAGQIALPDGAALGGYTLQATVSNESTSASFTVAAYKKPTFKVEVRPDRGENGNYVQGERIGVSARASYYFGAPLPGAPVQWSVFSAATSFQPAGYDDYTFVDPDVLYQQFQTPSNQQVSQFNGRTDALGAAMLHVPADGQGSPVPHLVTIEANVSSPTQQQVAQQSTVTVHPAGVYVGLRPRDYLPAPGTPQEIDVVTLRPDGTAAPRVAVTLAVQRRRIYSVMQYDPQLGYTWQNRYRDETLQRFIVTTDGAGRGVARVTLPDQGEFRVAGSAHDSLGNAARTAIYLYSMVPGNAGYIDWGIANNDRIGLVPDRRQYTIGQTAHVLVSAPFAGMRALVTLERGTILSHQVLTLRGNGPVLSIPITGLSVPNVYVSVVLFKGSGPNARELPVWKMGYTTLVVNPRERALSVRLALPPRARPGQRISVGIHTQDGYGRPVAADVGISLVDAAVLALASNSNGTLSNAFYAQRPLGIATAASMSLFIDRLNITPGNGKKGGGAGGGAGGLPTIRARFPDTAYWNPNVLTDANGNATIDLTLPDNLTTWHFTADGSTTGAYGNTPLLGTGGADLVSTKPVLIEPALPRFLTVRDHSFLGAVISNITDAAVRLSVGGSVASSQYSVSRPSLPTTGYRLLATPLTVPAHSDRAVYWSYTPEAEGSASVTLYARAPTPDLSDALRVSLPVEENSLVGAEAAATAGDTSGPSALETVRLPGAVEPGEGDLRLTLEPSLVSGLSGAAQYLLSYPYSCAEQTTSRLTGLLAIASLPARTFGLDAAQAARLPVLIRATAAHLYSQQGSDGGWGWWPEDPSDPYLSAYAYEGLTFMQENGYPADKSVMSNATSYLQGRLTAGPGDPNRPDDATRAFILYALSRAGHPDPAATAALYDRRGPLGPGARVALARALVGTFGAQDPRVRALLRGLSATAKLSSIGAHWDAGAGADWETMETSEGDTALVLRLFVSLDPHNPLVPRAVRWLLAQRGAGDLSGLPLDTFALSDVAGDAAIDPQGAWESTEATALALRALALYAQAAGETHPRYSYRIVVNGATAAQGTVTPATAGQSRSVVIPIDDLRRAGNKAVIRILRTPLPGGPPSGSMPLHYTVRLRYYPVPGSVGAVDSGISITRRYLARGGAPSGKGAASGSTLTVELRLVAPQDLSRVLIEDPLPAGAEAVDGTLLTSSVFAQPGGGPAGSGLAYTPPQPGQPQDLGLWIDHTELRDDRSGLFATVIPAGSYVYRYTIHLTTPGVYHVLPAHAEQLYEPEVFGHTAEGSFTVR